ncbi:AGAP000991-PA [Anopheles gambiae str. PEST]|uniref:serine--tRNA ligase n=2 Tax=gambiae species complex TaxID=44542 RepID=A7US27_ANOGA|nr:serine--tRNA ligase, mitochondrial [Anopheles gambiae]XP_040221040.1 serine--tRNA ligase, mitochondrial [Anopheles coluzzii]EDO64479.2 AGAP000991-PA [Anopheles gambiae str. PEST]
MFLPKCVATVRPGSCIIRHMSQRHFNLPPACFDTDYLLNPANRQAIEANIQHRKGIGDIQLVQRINEQLCAAPQSESERGTLQAQLDAELAKLPNRTHPAVVGYRTEPRIIERYNEHAKRTDRKYFQFGDICKRMNLYRMENLGNFTGHRSYYLTDELAELEHALICYAVDSLRQRNFQLVTVPDVLPGRIIESCGMSVHGERNQVYKLHGRDGREPLCLSGTSEMALAGYLAGRVLPADRLPQKLMAVSRCYRAETSALQEEKGIYRVHQFTKVEMFAVCQPGQSATVLEEFRAIEVQLFDQLGLHFLLLDMPPCELGAPAYRKYDIEAWMPGRAMYGEISSCSDCTDYQARRLGIRVRTGQEETFAHTVNGTACAIPRMLIALLENFQNEDYTITVPEVLRRYMGGKQLLRRRKVLPELKLTKRLVQEDTF